MVKNIKNLIRRKLPELIKKLLSRVYNKWNLRVVLDKNLVKDLAEYFNLSYEQTLCMLKVGTRLNKELWNILTPTTEEEIKRFYKIIPFYPFSLAWWHMSKGQRDFRDKILRISRGDVLDYGGGIGDLCLAFSKKGFNVTYADLQGKTSEFAKWVFKKRGYLNIPTLDVERDQEKIWGRIYDTIICIDTIEHIPHPEVILEKIAMHLKNNGKLVITALDFAGKEDHPMHLEINFDVEKLLNSFELFKSDIYDWLWIKNPKPR